MKIKTFYGVADNIGYAGASLFVAMLSVNVFWMSTLALCGISIGFAMMLFSTLACAIADAIMQKGVCRRWEKAMKKEFAKLFGRIAWASFFATLPFILSLINVGLTLAAALQLTLLLGAFVFAIAIKVRLR